MDAALLAVVTLLIFGFALVSARIVRADLSAPIVFVGAGVLLSTGVDAVDPHLLNETTKVLAEVTLVWVLFADAARVKLRELSADLRLYSRLLGLGLPLTIIGGTLVAAWLFPGLDIWLALLIGAALAPTDAALGAAVMTNPAVPARVRRVLNVESGLNDGIVTPVVTVAIAGAAVSGDGLPTVDGALIGIAVGLAVGSPGRPRRRASTEHRPTSRMGSRRPCRPRCSRPGDRSVRRDARARRERLRRRLRRRSRVRQHRRAGRRQGGVLRRGDRRPGVPADLAAVRRRRGPGRVARSGLADRRVRRAEPDGGAHASRRPGAPRLRVVAQNRRLHRVVRPSRPRLA